MRTQIIVGRHDDDFRLGLRVQRQIEIAGEIRQREPSSSSTRWLSECDLIFMARPRGAPRYFCPDGAWAFELFGFCLLAS
ncbi:bsr8047 [Bradyrhizobium diazoefficiens USDA 110]|uniref:Bsr8047 protein n=1 Tax=Bradyrhizobium diazoefficiens (strain JCM 10833 / BCRC 13528 / IAM 13628 / NBRC 14792 / USDA 110) TaxID=224911 RepID=Q89BV1_BRADU|nr:hypothetical protein AAV28_37940 [Bradyrhizobium diazoefficiens USDA 110]MDA9490324.1 hypothetical protein [Bradyrhizobium sp. CCBAU 11361]QBP26774.1 hypothetical protein Bdiaspc4_42595 [Bradyrhizobium diazoefficiens]RXH10609.1 hypothetical protein EAS54_31270 [Bradyrhizobium guangzhouense]BAC53312.1 bsr8047 [Bradyrhizobium diazoefficiens USDA 110]